MSVELACRSAAKTNEKLVNQNYATLFLSWMLSRTSDFKIGPMLEFCLFLQGHHMWLGWQKGTTIFQIYKMHSVFAAMLPFFQIMPRSKRQYRSRKYVASYKYCNFSPKINQGPSLYYVSGLGGWVKKMASFADVQYCIYAGQVGGWGPKRSKIC